MDEDFTMSMYISTEDLYKAKAAYYEKQFKESQEWCADYRDQIKGWETEVVNLDAQLKELQDAIMTLDPESIFAFSDHKTICIYCNGWNAEHGHRCPVPKLREVLKNQGIPSE